MVNNYQPLVSVMMNCYNGEEYLNQAIDSVLSQTYQNFEIVFWDNQSSDKSASIVKKYQDRRIKYYYAAEHTVLYAARNKAFEKCNGDLIAFLDADDWWDKAKLELQVKALNDDKYGFGYCNYYEVNEKGNIIDIFRKGKLPENWVLDKMLKHYRVSMLTLIIKRKALMSLDKIFDSRFHMIGDFDLVIRLAEKHQACCVQKPLSFYRLHSSNLSKTHSKQSIKELEIWYVEYLQRGSTTKTMGRYIRNKILYTKGVDYLSKHNNKPFWSCVLKISTSSIYKYKLLYKYIVRP